MLLRRLFILLIAIGGAYVLHTLTPTFPPHAQMVLSIAFFALVFWISEIIPLHITALLVGFLLILLVPYPAEKVFPAYFDKVVVLVLGGFALAVAMHKHRLDEYLSHKLLGKFAHSPNILVLGALSVTAAISLWIANSAAAALAMPLVLVILKMNHRKQGESTFAKAIVIAVAYGATIGGMGTLIGSTPNVLAQKFLTNEGISYGFIEWGMRAFPFTVIMVLVTWMILLFVFRPEPFKIIMKKHDQPFTREQWMVAGIFLLTVLLWITESIHGVSNSVIALMPVVLLSILGLIKGNDFKEMGWDSLILIGGGIALGMAIETSGLSTILAQTLSTVWENQPYVVVLGGIGLVGVLLTSFISNTAASAVFLPVIASLATVLGVNVTNLVTATALGVSLDFILPMGTPPTTIAYSTKYIHTKDLLKSGILVSLAGIILLAILAYFTW
ncbi:MAG: DASS family sodium-coupled anion symporter [Candidatus Diapherotrites archaeon]|uniref:DASS family sodium-coupled anion symporter n=1 Tax=Candidatus Iainarchaeum sp. TaxID=3101447 RepID=A0A8T4C5J7_9ARCH|nr:DASS family sodium-coupled anion symporter [Candidatus Diapherotrites archaeon]